MIIDAIRRKTNTRKIGGSTSFVTSGIIEVMMLETGHSFTTLIFVAASSSSWSSIPTLVTYSHLLSFVWSNFGFGTRRCPLHVVESSQNPLAFIFTPHGGRSMRRGRGWRRGLQRPPGRRAPGEARAGTTRWRRGCLFDVERFIIV